MLIVDTGVLLAAADRADPDHEVCRRLLEAEPGPLVTSPLVVAETGYLIDRQLGPVAEASFYRSIAAGDLRVEVYDATAWERVAELVDQYHDLPLGGADASLVVLAERLELTTVATLDRRHFSVVRMASGEPMQILPA